MIASEGFTNQRVCRYCGYECGLVGTGCQYVNDTLSQLLNRMSRDYAIFLPPPVEVENFVPEAPPPKRLQSRKESTAFVGGGAMRRRWR